MYGTAFKQWTNKPVMTFVLNYCRPHYSAKISDLLKVMNHIIAII